MWRKVFSWLSRVLVDSLVILVGAALIAGLWYVLFILRPFC